MAELERANFILSVKQQRLMKAATTGDTQALPQAKDPHIKAVHNEKEYYSKLRQEVLERLEKLERDIDRGC